MSAHKAVAGRRRRISVRAVLALGMLLGVAQLSTMASWSDQAGVNTGPIKTGTLDLKVGVSAADQLPAQGGTWTYDALTITDLLPGESVAARFVVGNGGSTPLKYTGTVATTNNLLFNATSPGLQVTVTTGGTASNSGTKASGNRTGTCTGTATAVTNTGVSTTPASIGAATTLQPTATTAYCVVAKLATTATNDMQGKTTALTFVFNATQPS